MPKTNHIEAPNLTESCHYRRHLKGARLSIYAYALALGKSAKVPALLLFHASIERVCLETRYSHDTVTSALADLVRAGWLIPLGGNRRAAKIGGAFQPNTYQVIEHDKWAASHRGECERIVRDWKNPPRENTATEETGEPVAGKSVNSVAGNPPTK